MPKKPVKNQKKQSLGKGVKVLLALLALSLVTVALYAVMKAVNKSLIQSKSMAVQPDLELDGSKDGKGAFKEPVGIAVDAQGNFYVTEFSGHRVQKFDPNGTPLMSIGQKGKEPGEFNQPSGIYVDPNGIIYVCDTFSNPARIEKFDPKGKFLKSWDHGFFGPRSLVGDQRGRIYVIDTGNHKVQVFDTEGRFQMEFGGNGTANGKFQEPDGCTVDPEGFLYVADADNNRIQKFNPDGKFVSAFKVATWKGKNLELPYLAFRDGFLYATNSSEGAVLKYTPAGKLVAILRKKDKGGFPMAAGIAVDSLGRVYVVEKEIGRVARFTPPVAPPASK